MNTKQQSEHLTRTQKNILQALINARNIEELRAQLVIRPSTLKRWLQNDFFRSELIQYIEIARQISGVLVARSLPDAAVRLNELLYTDKPDSDRKTCADILKLSTGHNKPKQPEKPRPPAPPVTITDPVECARLYKLHRPKDDRRDGDDRNDDKYYQG